MIIWLASYPKRGNTWVRAFLSSLMYTDDGMGDFKDMQISQYPLRSNFKGLTNEFENINLLSEKWILSQDLLNLDNKIKFLKTHHVMCNFGKNSFTDYNNTFGVIYIVRDPRNVITSILNYFSKPSYKEAKEFLFDEKKIIGVNLAEKDKKIIDNNIITLVSSWKTHYNSWKNFKKNFLLIKYENLVNDEFNEFTKIRKYLEEKLKLSFSDKKFINAISSCSFQKLQKMEQTKGFTENVLENPMKKVNFFNLGPKNDYKKFLDKEISEDIKKNFFSEMKELGYV